MNPINFRHAQREVWRIMRQMGKEPARFDTTLQNASPPHKWTCQQVFFLSILVLTFFLVWYTVISILVDMWQKGAFE